jgi:hypothetical protein
MRAVWQRRIAVVQISKRGTNPIVTPQIEERVAALEAEIAQLKKHLGQGTLPQRQWWKEIAGSFANDPVFQKAMKLGEQYRRSLRPKPTKSRQMRHVRSRHRSS